MRFLAAFLLFALFAVAGVSAATVTVPVVNSGIVRGSKPNVLLVLADDLAWADVGFNNPYMTDTPFIDSIAKQGMVFSDFHSGATICAQSRATLMTGRTGPRTGLFGTFSIFSTGDMPANETVLPEYLSTVGYTSTMQGKWHIGTRMPVFHGFVEYAGIPLSVDHACVDFDKDASPIYVQDWYGDIEWYYKCKSDPKYYPNRARMVEPTDVGLPYYDIPAAECGGQNCDLFITEQPANLTTVGVKYVNKFKDLLAKYGKGPRPWFHYMALTHPHTPLTFMPEFKGTADLQTAFGDTLREMDWQFKEMYNAIDAAGILDNTLIIFMSDNGPWNEMCTFAGTAEPYIGAWKIAQGGGGSMGKGTNFEGGHRVPAFMYWKGKIAPSVTDALTSGMDVVPTLATLAGYSLTPGLVYDGKDLTKLVFDYSWYLKNNPTAEDSATHRVDIHVANGLAHEWFWHQGMGRNITAGRWNNLKFIFNAGGVMQDCQGRWGVPSQHNPPLIFNLDVDPSEYNDLSATTPAATITRILTEYKNYMDSINGTPYTTMHYSVDPFPQMCCNPNYYNCRCTHQVAVLNATLAAAEAARLAACPKTQCPPEKECPVDDDTDNTQCDDNAASTVNVNFANIFNGMKISA